MRKRIRKMYCLSTCSTCARILKTVDAVRKGVAIQDIRTEKITPAQLLEMKEMAGSYEALFSKRAVKYHENGLAAKKLTEQDYRDLILEEDTFLKRPVAILGETIFIGNDKKTVAQLKAALA